MAFKSLICAALLALVVESASGETADQKLFSSRVVYEPTVTYELLNEIVNNPRPTHPKDFITMLSHMIEANNITPDRCTDESMERLLNVMSVPYKNWGAFSIEKYLTVRGNEQYEVCLPFMKSKFEAAKSAASRSARALSSKLMKTLVKLHYQPQEARKLKFPYEAETYIKLSNLIPGEIDWLIVTFINNLNPLDKKIGPRNQAWFHEIYDENIAAPCNSYLKSYSGLEDIFSVFAKPGMAAHDDPAAQEVQLTFKICQTLEKGREAHLASAWALLSRTKIQ